MIPDYIKIGYSQWRINTEPSLLEEETLGKSYHQIQQIHLQPNMSQDKQHEVLLHEILHACYTLAGLDDEDDEEEVVNRISPFLLQVLKDNDHLFCES